METKQKVAVLKLIRKTFTDISTIGELYINNNLFCNTIEDKDRGLISSMVLDKAKIIKVYGKTAVPYGTYDVQLIFSPKFKRVLPRLLNVLAFDGILIHNGNTAGHSEGCIIVGKHDGKTKDFISNSKETLQKLLIELKKYDKIFIEITK